MVLIDARFRAVNALIFIGIVVGMTIILVLLFKYRVRDVSRWYMMQWLDASMMLLMHVNRTHRRRHA